VKKIYTFFNKKIFTYLLFVFICANVILAKEDFSIYFSRTISYYKFFPEVINPLSVEDNNFSLVSEYRFKNYYTLNPINLLTKITKDTDIGVDGLTFVSYEKYENNDILIPSTVLIDYYTENKIKNQQTALLKNQIVSNFKADVNSPMVTGNKINILNRDIAGTNVAINIKGDIKIFGGLEFIDKEGGSLTNQNQNTWNLDIEQQQKFDLEGTVGDRLTVSAEQNSQSDFDWENSLLLEYKGHDNEIVKSVKAGNISLSLPHTQLVSVGMGKREGLFGITMVNELGPLSFHTIIGKEQVQKESFPLGQQDDGLIKYDYQFLRDKYFFVNEIFKLQFYPLSENNEHYVNQDYVIKEFKLYKRANTNEIETGTYPGKAYINPLEQDYGIEEPGFWIELEDQNMGNDYFIDKYLGYVRLNSVSTSDLIAAHYTIGKYENGQIVEVSDPILTGTNIDAALSGVPQDQCINDNYLCEGENLIACEDIEEYIPCNGENTEGCCDYIENNSDLGSSYEGFQQNNILLKIIKTNGQQDPTSATWHLMMKNVYNIGTNNFTAENPPEIEIIHVGGQLGTETATANGNTFLNIFGLDKMDTNGNIIGDGTEGDGKIDLSPNLINEYGDMFLPFHMPFSYDESESPNYSVNGTTTSNPFFWGNRHEDLNATFDGSFSDLENNSVMFSTEGGSSYFYEYYTYDNGPAMYYSDLQSNITSQREFAIKINNASQSTTINLGFMIVEGSETLLDGSTVLTKGIDYTIDYFSGTLTLISERAKNNSASLTISYDKNEIVSFDQKLILGNYFKYDFNKTSNLFGGLYYYQKTIRDDKVEIGYEPMQNFMWHIGGSYERELENLNNSINSIGNIELQKSSNFDLLAEFAQIQPNPNPLNVAYLDDFESSKRYTSVSIGHSSWKIASVPADTDIDQNDFDIYNREKIYWYNPYEDIPTNMIWPNMQVESGSTEPTLWLEIPELNNVSGKWWNGIMTKLYESDYNQTNNKYVDIWLNIDGVQGFNGYTEGLSGNASTSPIIFHIDIGEINEDSNNNEKLDTEDIKSITNEFGEGIMGDNLLDEGEDVGIDACPDAYEDGWGACLCSDFLHEPSEYFACDDSNPETFYELYMEECPQECNSDSEKINCCVINPSDPNDDSFSYNAGSLDFSHYNGTSGNSSENTYPDTEDLNGDQFLDNTNAYFTYSINLSDEFEVESELTTNWKLYRIPLADFSEVNETEGVEASWERVTNVRLWVEGYCYQNINCDDSGKIGVASIEIVGNEWEELGTVHNNDIGSVGYLAEEFNINDNISIQLINNEENSEYISPPGVSGNSYNINTTGENQTITEKEQSLVIDFTDLDNSATDGLYPDTTVFIKKNFGYSSLDNEKQNSFFAYKNMEMFFNAQEVNSWYDTDGVDLCFRLGKDDNYYEIRKPFKSDEDISIDQNGWQNLDISLDDLTRYKLFRDPLENYIDHGIDGCADAHESGFFMTIENLIVPGCLPQELIDLGITTQKICEIDDEYSDQYDEYINHTICRDQLFGYYDDDGSDASYGSFEDNDDRLPFYWQNKLDPNGDNMLVEGACVIYAGIDNLSEDEFFCTNNENEDLDNFFGEGAQYYLGTEDNEEYECYDINAENCFYEDDIAFYGEEVSDDWDENGLYSTPGTYLEDDELWAWGNYCSEDISLDEEFCNDWNEIDISDICTDCTELRIKGEPAINRIEYVMIGVANNNDHTVYGSVWLNELRMTGVKKDAASAFKVSASFNLGELLDMDLSYSEQEANFHKLEQRLGTGNHSKNYTFNLGFSPSKLLREDFFELPLTFKYTKNISSPMYKPGSDIVLGSINNTPEYLQTLTDKITFSTYLKTNLSNYNEDNILYKYILDKSKMTYSYSWDKQSNPTISNKEIVIKKYIYTYNFNFSKDNVWYPFKDILETENWQHSTSYYPMKFFKDFKIFYSPEDINYSSTLTDNDNYTIKREIFGGTITDEQTLDLHRTFKTNIRLSENFSFNYTIDMKNNLNELMDNNYIPSVSDIFDITYSPGLKKNLTEKFSFTYTPPVFTDWLSPRFSYVPTYIWTRDMLSGTDATADLKSDNKLTGTFTFSFQKFIEQFYQSESKKTSSSGYSSSRGRRKSSSNNSNKEETEKPFIIDQPHFKTIFKFLHDIGQRVSNINITYTYKTQNNYNNLSADIDPGYNFKLGFEEQPTDALFSNSSSTTILSTSNTFSQELRFNTSIQITDNLSLSNMEYRIALSANKQSDSGYNENYSQSYFPIGASGNDGVPIFGWSINLRGLEKYMFLDKWFSSFTLNHSYNGEKTKVTQEEIVQKIDYKRNFTPFIGFKMKTKTIPIDINLTYNNILTISNEGDQIKRNISDQINLKFDYTKKSGFRIPVFFLRDVYLDNQVHFELTLGWEESSELFSYFQTSELNDFEMLEFRKTYNIKPEITYSLSKFADANFWYDFIHINDSNTGSEIKHKIGFNVRVYFESF